MTSKTDPFFTIVIVNYNHGDFLEAAIKSVLKQTCKDFELILVDGGSNDCSCEIISKYQNDFSWWCSESDHGQSHAFNKGFSHAKGEFLAWLNADDVLLQDALKNVKEYLHCNDDALWVGGGTIFFNEWNKVVWCTKAFNNPLLFPKLLSGTAVGGPSSFFKRSVYQSSGGFDESLHFRMDTDLWFKFYFSGISLHHLPKYLWGFRVHGASKTSSAFQGSPTQPMLDESEVLANRYGYSVKTMRYKFYILKLLKVIFGNAIVSRNDTNKLAGANIESISS